MQAGRAPLLLLVAMASAPGPARAEAAADSPCRACHEERFQAGVTHFPAAAGLCQTCHQVKPRHLEDGDTGAVTKVRSAEKTCFTCHDPLPKAKVRHAALDLERACAGCHDPHGGERRHHLRAAPPALCTGCHGTLFAAPVPAPGGAPDGDALAAAEEAPPHRGLVQGETCLGCHGAHGAQDAKLLLRDPASTCLTCHAQRLPGRGRTLASIRWKVDETGGGHGVAAWAGQREGRNVGRECLACHVAHPRAGGGLLAKGSIEALCFGCHRQQDFPETSPGRRTHPGTRHPAGGGQDPAQPGRAFTCVSCHEPHGSTQAALFRYRPIKGAPEPSRLCGHCHGEAMGVARPAASPPWNEQDSKDPR